MIYVELEAKITEQERLYHLQEDLLAMRKAVLADKEYLHRWEVADYLRRRIDALAMEIGTIAHELVGLASGTEEIR